jgi:hypothetical protein
MVTEFLAANDVFKNWPEVKWLFMAVPTYAQWLDLKRNGTDFACRIYVAEGGTVQDRTSWWIT